MRTTHLFGLLLPFALFGCIVISDDEWAWRTRRTDTATPTGNDTSVDTGCASPSTWYPDGDGDGHGDPGSAVEGCSQPSGTVAVGDDCDDSDASVHPGATENCATPADDDCDGSTNAVNALGCTEWYVDGDGDGYGGTAAECLCTPEGDYQTDIPGDCDDGSASVHPGASEVCGNGVDDNCDDSAGTCVLSGEYAPSDADARLLGSEQYQLAGRSVAYAGDVDSDGKGDVWVGASWDSTAFAKAGAAYFVRGPLSGDVDLSGATAVLTGEESGGNAGTSIAGNGDFDGDGVPDVVVGAPFASGRGTKRGVAYVIEGPVSGAIGLANADVRLLGESDGDYAGWSVALVGDMDADGKDEAVVGAYARSSNGSAAGEVYLVKGGASGEIDLGWADHQWIGEAAGDRAGHAVAAAGDVNGDGEGEVLVGADHNDTAGEDAGAVYVLQPSSNGTTSLADATRVVRGQAAGDQAGAALAALGDVNGDGYDDFAVGAPGSDAAGSDAGAVYVVLGAASGIGTLADSVRFTGAEAGDAAGSAVAGPGDVDEDGHMDLLVGAYRAVSGNGRAWLVYGPLSGDASLADADAAFEGLAGDQAGYALSGGDLNGDGAADLLIAAPTGEGGATSSGLAYVLDGGGF